MLALHDPWPVVLWTALAYLVSAIPMGVLVGRLRGVDIRAHGSGNIGATNASRTLGRGWGKVVFGLDFLKSLVPVWLARAWTFGGTADEALALAIVGFAAVVGHIYPVYLRFRGGKGVACGFAVLLVLTPWAALVAVLLYLQTLILTRMTSAASLIGVSAAMLVVLFDPRYPVPYRALAVAVAAVVWLRHRDNIGGLLEEARARKARFRTPPPNS
jgi:glycerol-3-phosphate acyltransferase PlsY